MSHSENYEEQNLKSQFTHQGIPDDQDNEDHFLSSQEVSILKKNKLKNEPKTENQSISKINFVLLILFMLITFEIVILIFTSISEKAIKDTPLFKENIYKNIKLRTDLQILTPSDFNAEGQSLQTDKQSPENEEKLKIKLQNGQEKELNYLKSLVYQFQDNNVIEQEQRPLITIEEPEDTQQILQGMAKGDYGSQLNYAIKLLQNPQNEEFLKAQYHYYEYKYEIGKYKKQLPFCLVSAGRNMMRNTRYIEFIKSIERQNYTNYQLIVVDDASTDNSISQFSKQIKNSPKLKKRTILIHNRQNIGALGNKDFAIRNYCVKDSIIVDIDADDFLVGRQILNVMNALYQSTDNWFIYSKEFYKRPGSDVYQEKGALISDENFAKNSYRTSKQWVTTELRTYMKKLYLKIPISYLLEESGDKYHFWASDRFFMYAMTQLSGKQHMMNIPHLLYYYNVNPKRSQCVMSKILIIEYEARFQTPLLKLNSLEDDVKITQGYVIPDRTIKEADKWKSTYDKCKLAGEVQ